MKEDNNPSNPWENNSDSNNSHDQTTAPENSQIDSSVFSPSNPSFRPSSDIAQPTVSNNSSLPAHDNTQLSSQSVVQNKTNSFQPSTPINVSSQITKKSKKKLIILLLSVVILLGLLAAAYMYFIYIPNKPENAWKTGFSRTGTALQTITNKSLDENSLKNYKKSEINGNFNLTTKDSTATGSMNAKYDENKVIGEVLFSRDNQGDQEQKLSINLLSEVAQNKLYPDVFLKFNGLKSLGEIESDAELSKYENKWIFIDNQTISDYFKSITNEEPKKDYTISSKDISDFSKQMVTVANQYIFTDDINKAIIDKKGFVGMEISEGKKAYHYKASINQAHVRDMCKAVIDVATQTKIGKIYLKNQDDINNAKKECDATSDEVNKKSTSQEFDLWIDARYKLIHKIRIYDDNSAQRYVDFGQNYSGGDEVEFFVNYINTSSDATEIKLTFKSNFKNLTTKFDGSGNAGSDTDKISGKVNIESKPYKSDITLDKPKDFINAKDSIFKNLNVNSDDKERKNDLLLFSTFLEEYFAREGAYPSSTDITNRVWVKTNLKVTDDQIFRDPKGIEYTFVNTPTPERYSYIATNCQPNKTKCQEYVLTAILSDGTKYEQKTSNSNQ